jgi:hypothetical protein
MTDSAGAAAHDGGGEVRRAADAVDGNAHVVDLEPQLRLHAARTAGLIDWLVAAACRSAPQPVSPEGRRQRDSSERRL